MFFLVFLHAFLFFLHSPLPPNLSSLSLGAHNNTSSQEPFSLHINLRKQMLHDTSTFLPLRPSGVDPDKVGGSFLLIMCTLLPLTEPCKVRGFLEGERGPDGSHRGQRL